MFFLGGGHTQQNVYSWNKRHKTEGVFLAAQHHMPWWTTTSNDSKEHNIQRQTHFLQVVKWESHYPEIATTRQPTPELLTNFLSGCRKPRITSSRHRANHAFSCRIARSTASTVVSASVDSFHGLWVGIRKKDISSIAPTMLWTAGTHDRLQSLSY